MIDIRVIAKGLCHKVWAGLGLETAWAVIKIYSGSQLVRSKMGSDMWSIRRSLCKSRLGQN